MSAAASPTTTLGRARADGGVEPIVLIEDSPSDALMVQATLADPTRPSPECVWAETLGAGLAAIDRHGPSCVLVDLGLPDSDGLATLDAVLEHAPDLPVVVLTGLDDDRLGELAVRRGAQDYLVKGKADAALLVRTIRYATERKRAELAERRREQRFRSLLDVAPDAIIACDANRVITFWNRGAETTYGWSPAEALGKTLNDLISDGGPDIDAKLASLAATGHWQGEATHRTRDGRSIVVEGWWSVLSDESGAPVGLLGANRDITARRAMEEELAESRTRLADLIDIAPDAILSLDQDLRITLFNQGAEATFGYSADEMLGRSLDILLPEEHVARHRDHVARFAAEAVRARKMGERGEVCGRRRDGTTFPAEASISKLDRGGAVTYTVILRDVSRRKQAEEALRSSEARLAAILDTLPIGVVVARPNGDVVYVNQRARDFVGPGYEGGESGRDEVRSRARREGTADPYPPDDIPIVRALRGESGTVSDLELEVGDRRIPMRISFAPIRGRTGEVELGIAVFDDLTDERAVEQRLADQADQLQRSNAELEQFAYIASHDLSQPLRTVAGFVQLLAQRYQGQLDSDADEFIDFALDGVKRMQTLIQDLLSYSRVSRLEYTLDLVDCAALVEEVAESLGAMGSIQITSPLPTVYADAGQLRRVFQNLLANGLKFAAADRPAVVDVSAAAEGAGWRFSIRDNGIGIAPEHRERVFKMFQRLHSQDDYPGNGIGLPICERIVERHGGRIWVEGAEGEGSLFQFTIPARTVAQ